MIDINTVRKILEFNTEAAAYKRQNAMFGDETKRKKIIIKYEQQVYYLNKLYPKLNVKTILIDPKERIYDDKKLDIEYLKNYIYKGEDV